MAQYYQPSAQPMPNLQATVITNTKITKNTLVYKYEPFFYCLSIEWICQPQKRPFPCHVPLRQSPEKVGVELGNIQYEREIASKRSSSYKFTKT